MTLVFIVNPYTCEPRIVIHCKKTPQFDRDLIDFSFLEINSQFGKYVLTRLQRPGLFINIIDNPI
jgi:hypothetical protein